MYDRSTLLSTSVINGAKTAPIPVHFPNPRPSFSTTDANRHMFPLRTSTSPADCSTGANLEQGQPHGDSLGDFEAPEYVKGPIQFALSDFVSFDPSATIETGGAEYGMTRRHSGCQTCGDLRRSLQMDSCRVVLVCTVECSGCLGSARANPRPS